MAGPSPAMAAFVVSRSAPAGRSFPRKTVISGSVAGFVQPESESVEPDGTSADCIKKPTSGALVWRRSIAVGPPKASFQPRGLWPELRSTRRRRSCSVIPREMRGSSQAALMIRMPCRSVAFGRNFVAGGFERAGAAPAPHEDDIFAAGIVETVPVAARSENHIALRARLAARVCIDESTSFDHHEKFIHVGMTMFVMARAGRENGPADEKSVRASGFLIDEELHLHVDPPFVARQPADFGDIAEIVAVGPHFNIPPMRR